MKFAANAVLVLLSFAVASSQGRLLGTDEEHKKIDGVLVDVFEEEEPEAEVKGKDRKLEVSMESRDRLMESENLLTAVKSLLAKEPMFLQDIEEQRKVVEAARAEMRNVATDIVEMAISQYNAPVDDEVENTVVEELCFGNFLLEMLDGYVDDMPVAQGVPGLGDDCTEDDDCFYGLVCSESYTCYPSISNAMGDIDCEEDDECGFGMACDLETFTCYPDMPSDGELGGTGLGEGTGLGNPCDSYGECGEGFACDMETYECFPDMPSYGELGSSCTDTGECIEGLVCDMELFECYPDINAVEGTGVGNCDLDGECDEGFTCDMETYECYPDTEVPESAELGGGTGVGDCDLDGECGEGFTCDMETFECYPDMESPEGVGLEQVGGYCRAVKECAEGLTCDMSTYMCMPPSDGSTSGQDTTGSPPDFGVSTTDNSPGPVVDFDYLTNPNSTVPIGDEEGDENTDRLIDPFEEEPEEESPPVTLDTEEVEGGEKSPYEPVPDDQFLDEVDDPDGNAGDEMYNY